ncbi:M56 family metallopeptidase [Myxococcaceae bacterium JPH2]|nr:M56 family metallopeptidase [Myxococcaceae bacterium JPH2]
MSAGARLESWAQGLAEWLAHGVWQTSVVVLFAAVAMWLLRHRSARTRYAVGCLALALLVLAPLATVLQTRAPPAPVTWGWTEGPLGTARPSLVEAQALASVEPLSKMAPAPAWAFADWGPAALGGLWLVGVLGGLLRLSLAWRRTSRWWVRPATPASSALRQTVSSVAERLGLRRAVRVVESPFAPSPLVLGVVRPLLVLPRGVEERLAPEQLEAVLAHELAHVRRHDTSVNFVQCLVDVLFFFHPAARWLSNQVRLEREHCCDDAAVGFCGSARVYSGALLGLEELRQEGAMLSLGAGAHPLAGRVRRLLGLAPMVGARGVWRLGGVLVVLAASGLAWTWEAPAQTARPEPGAPGLAGATCSRAVYPKDFTAIASYAAQGRVVRSRLFVSRCGRIRLEPADRTPVQALLYDASTLEWAALDVTARTYDVLPAKSDLGLPLHLPGGCTEQRVSCASQGDADFAGRRTHRWHRVHAPHDTVTQWMDAELGYPIREDSSLFGAITLSDIRIGDQGTAPFIIPSDYTRFVAP